MGSSGSPGKDGGESAEVNRVDSNSFAKTVLGIKRALSVPELLVAGEKSKGGRETTAAAGKVADVNAAAEACSEQSDGAPTSTPWTPRT